MSKKPVPPTITMDAIDDSLVTVADALLADYFFDPEHEEAYKKSTAARRSGGNDAVLHEEKVRVHGELCVMRIEALAKWATFRVTLSHPDFDAAIEGSWNFESEMLDRATVTDHRGGPDTLNAALLAIEENWLRDLSRSELDDLLPVEHDEEGSLVGDDPKQPPPANSADRSRVKAIAKRMTRKLPSMPSPEDRAWLEETPQSLPLITEALIAAAQDARQDAALVDAYLDMLALQLEFVRYRQDRGWAWADKLLLDFQQHLLTFGADGGSRSVFMQMASALTTARVPVSEDMQGALAEAGFETPPDEVGTPDELLGMLQGLMSELAHAAESPFDIIATLNSSASIMPADMRALIATEMAASDEAIVRDAVPLMLLDADATVRRAAVAALDGIAAPHTLSSASLRRTITMRNWLPEDDHGAVDAAVRKARLAGVEIGSWPAPSGESEYHASMIDGSGAQSVFMVTRGTKKGHFGAVLLRHDEGIIDAWEDADLSRGKLNKQLRAIQQEIVLAPVSRGFVDAVIQHAIGTSVEHEAVPPGGLLQLAERLEGGQWKAQPFDVSAETERLFGGLSDEERSEAGLQAGHTQAAAWMSDNPTFGSWYEEGPDVAAALAHLPRSDKPGLIDATLHEVLPAYAAKWSRQFLMVALWCEAADDPDYRRQLRGMATVARALNQGEALETIPAMALIAGMTVTNLLDDRW